MPLGQRRTPPYDCYTYRDGDACGGPPPPQRGWTLANGLVNNIDRYPGNANDGRVFKDRSPSYHYEYIAAGRSTGLVDWTAAGPVRPELHMKTATYRREAGSSNTRHLDPNKVHQFGTQDQGHGLHTDPPTPKVASIDRYKATPQMKNPRQDRLRPGQYSGQSYSQTTRIQGG